MQLYHYKAVGADGVALEGDMEARNQAAVVERLQATGYIPIRVEEAQPAKSAASTSFGWARSNRVSQAEIGVFTREIATLLHAGLPLDRALEILVALSENDKVRRLLIQVRDDVRGGASLSAAMDAQKGVFSRFYLNMVRAGEAGGALGPVLMRITEFMERSKMLKETVMSALIYPAILIVVAVTSVMMLLIFVVPQFSLMFQQSGKALPLPTQIVIGAGDFLRHDWWMLLLGGLAIFLLMRQQLQNAASRYRWDGWFLRMPLVGDLVAKVEVARFSRSLGTLLGNGVTLLNALFIVKETLNNRVMAEGLDQVATQLKQGLGLGNPMMETGLFPKLAVHMVMVGEETGQLEEMLLRVANVYDNEVQSAVKRMLGLMEPVLILGLGLLIGGIIMSILLAILGINDLAI
ncbi:MAG: type II secretion system F family protein [Gallionellaceae bacterium]